MAIKDIKTKKYINYKNFVVSKYLTNVKRLFIKILRPKYNDKIT